MSKRSPKNKKKIRIVFGHKKNHIYLDENKFDFLDKFCRFGSVCNALASATQLTRWSGAFRVAVAFLGETECFENVVHDMSS